jgi:hypothetical protein
MGRICNMLERLLLRVGVYLILDAKTRFIEFGWIHRDDALLCWVAEY